MKAKASYEVQREAQSPISSNCSQQWTLYLAITTVVEMLTTLYIHYC